MTRSQTGQRFLPASCTCANGHSHAEPASDPDGMMAAWYCGCDRPDPDAGTMVLAWLMAKRDESIPLAALRLARSLRCTFGPPETREQACLLAQLDHAAGHRPAPGRCASTTSHPSDLTHRRKGRS